MSDTKSKSDSQRAALFLFFAPFPKSKRYSVLGNDYLKSVKQNPQIYRFDDFILLTNE